MTETRSVSLPFRLEFGLEDLGGRANLNGPYSVVEVQSDRVVVAITTTIAGISREFREKLSPHDPHPQASANWRAAAKQLGLKP